MKRLYFLGIDCQVVVNETQSQQRILLNNPEVLKDMRTSQIWNRLLNTFGKCEIEFWIAEEIVDIAKKDFADNNRFADFSEFGEVVIHSYEPEEDRMVEVISRDSFKRRFCSLPIFKVIKDAEDVILLEFIPQ